MGELTGKILDLDGMRAVLRSGGSVAYNGKQSGHRIITHERNLPTVDELVADGYIDVETASAEIDKQVEKLQRVRAKLPRQSKQKPENTVPDKAA